MDEVMLKTQFTSTGVSLKFRVLPTVAGGQRQERITSLVSVEAGPRGKVYTYVCRPAAEARPRERHLLQVVIETEA